MTRELSRAPTQVDIVKAAENSVEVRAIYMEQFLHGDKISKSRDEHCRHHFHFACAFKWLVKSELCPCCRRNYVGKNEEANTATDAGRSTLNEVPHTEPESNSSNNEQAGPHRIGVWATVLEVIERAH